MPKKEFVAYAVRARRKSGIFKTWEECFRQVNGYPNAVYKAFYSLAEAEAFLKAGDHSEPAETSRLVSDKLTGLRKVFIYTDGATIGNPGPGGYGIVMIYGKHRKEFMGGFRLTTNNRMELMAALVGLGMLKSKCSVTIYTDSQYLADSISRGWAKRWRANGWKTKEGKQVSNVDMWQQLLEQCDKHIVTFEWIRGHAGNPENERCDYLAMQLASSRGLPADAGYENQFGPSKENSLFGS